MTSRLALVILASLSAAAAANSEQTGSATDVAGFHLKNRSSFTSPEATRPPFWPIGWSKTAGMPAPTATKEPELKIDADMFAVTSILLGNPPFAVINGKSYTEGEFLRPSRSASATPKAAGAASSGNLPANAKVQVKKIADGQVTLAGTMGTFTVVLKRPELLERKADEALNDR